MAQDGHEASELGHTQAYEVIASPCGRTVWVNSGLDGSCIGRFSKTFGIDVHRTASDQISGKGECLFCTHGAAGKDLWDRFRAEMLAHHGVKVDEALIGW